MLCPQRSNEPKAKQETTLQTKVSLAMNAQMHTGLKYEKQAENASSLILLKVCNQNM